MSHVSLTKMMLGLLDETLQISERQNNLVFKRIYAIISPAKFQIFPATYTLPATILTIRSNARKIRKFY
jgi:hypothetical protein